MNKDEIKRTVEKQREYFNTRATLSASFRIEKLKELREIIIKYTPEIEHALYADLGKSDFETYMCEISMAISEISYLIKHIKSFMKMRRVRTPVSQFYSNSYTLASPYGNTLIMSPWNYPFLLTIDPLADAISAGNTAIVKPSEYSPATSALIAKMLGEIYSDKYIAVVTGGREENASLLCEKFDFIFFTGSQHVGKEVLRHTAETLTPAVLELGGKSPCIVDESAKIALSAKRIVFGKYLNAGQTCVAPDYIICERSIKEKLINEIKREISEQFGQTPIENPDYGRIVSEKHFNRLVSLIDERKVVIGGSYSIENLKIAPTVMDNVTFDDEIMKDEIFGPILPVLTVERADEIYSLLKDKPKPLALYIFSENKKRVNEFVERLSFGGGCINDTIIHLASNHLPFGGVGESGMGAYHGKYGFDSFSHIKGIVDKKTWIDLPVRYQPYKREKYLKFIRGMMK